LRFSEPGSGLAETAAHHPDIDIRYDRVRLALVTTTRRLDRKRCSTSLPKADELL